MGIHNRHKETRLIRYSHLELNATTDAAIEIANEELSEELSVDDRAPQAIETQDHPAARAM